MQNEALATIAVLGGTGKEGGGLALRWAHKGHKVIIGSRTAERAQEAADTMNATLGGSSVVGAANPDAAAQADIIVLAVPYAAQQLQGMVKTFAFWPQLAMGQPPLAPALQQQVLGDAVDMFLGFYAEPARA